MRAITHPSLLPRSSPAPVRLYVADLPGVDQLLPYLRRLDETRTYSNFGPLETDLRRGLGRLLDPACPPEVALASSGSDALALALRALDLPPGARVLLPALTFPATAWAVQAAGLTPVLADVDAEAWVLTPEIAEAHLDGVAAVLPVATFGLALDAAAWDDFTDRTGLPVVFDAAAALIRQPMPRRCVAVFSLHATKPLGVGEGGLVAAHDPDLIDMVRRLSNFGFDGVRVTRASGNAKLSEYHAAVGLAQLARAPQIRAALDRAREAYGRHLPAHLTPPGEMSGLVVAVPAAAEAAAGLAAVGVETRQWFQPDLTGHPAYQAMARAGDLPNTAGLRGRILGLPFHGHLAEDDIIRVCAQLKAALALRAAVPEAQRV
ncbi:aminotransferase class I/II-fold pyridoxal phosphate-dependent enzyme [Phenylobacterium aquaticum]|uniref:aminotransferase class I/II-fold pyridoxal phosphate-dependent enzyme n=1 Tax=Phenylobacterium aquaticum TaxID=1763816 RepID=UPI0026ECE4A4|nr:aminotransferase class I/II-fold pyridoxal phosphate-dependent enzyme [Phenylobacterium aquaticum]